MSTSSGSPAVAEAGFGTKSGSSESSISSYTRLYCHSKHTALEPTTQPCDLVQSRSSTGSDLRLAALSADTSLLIYIRCRCSTCCGGWRLRHVCVAACEEYRAGQSSELGDMSWQAGERAGEAVTSQKSRSAHNRIVFCYHPSLPHLQLRCIQNSFQSYNIPFQLHWLSCFKCH